MKSFKVMTKTTLVLVDEEGQRYELEGVSSLHFCSAPTLEAAKELSQESIRRSLKAAGRLWTTQKERPGFKPTHEVMLTAAGTARVLPVMVHAQSGEFWAHAYTREEWERGGPATTNLKVHALNTSNPWWSMRGERLPSQETKIRVKELDEEGKPLRKPGNFRQEST